MDNPGNLFLTTLNSAKSLLLLLPANPSFDEVAAGLSLYLALSRDKNVAISCPSPMRVEFNRLVGVNKISTEVGNRNLLIKFANYKADSIERVSYDIENREFQLTVIPKQGVEAPRQDQIVFSYSGGSGDTVILIGGGNETDFPGLRSNELERAKVVHLATQAFASTTRTDIISLAKPGSSVSEIVANLIKESGYEIDADIATNLLMGIEQGSSQFSHPEVGADTFSIAAELMRLGGKRAPQKKEAIESLAPGLMVRPSTPPVTGPAVEPIEAQEEPKIEKPPQSWLQNPRIYRGGSIS